MVKRFVLFVFLSFIGINVFNQELPADFPIVNTNQTGETGEGYIFFSISSDMEGVGYYVFMVDDEGKPYKYKKLYDDYAYDFKMQPNGLLSYASFLSRHSYTGGGNCVHIIMDENMNTVDSVQLKNGYIAEAHDYQLLPNGHSLAFGYYLTQMDLSDIVDGGYPNALVSGGVVQELDQDKNVVWQWRSWDHYDPETYSFGRRSARATVSEFHLNTINLDRDDNMILATPSWTKKIDRQTGEIMWHLGGDENEFAFVGVDSLVGVQDVTGHTFYRLENGNFLVYDNAPRVGEETSEAHEYRLDEENKIAEKIKTFRPDSVIRGWHRGSAQRLPNGNTLVGWGGAFGERIPVCTEFDAEGNIVFEAYFEKTPLESYRAQRFPYPPVASYVAKKENIEAGNMYIMDQGDSISTGVEISIESLTAGQNNELLLEVYDYAPQFPEFEDRAPMVLAKRILLDHANISDIQGKMTFNATTLNIDNPDLITIYHRESKGLGTFRPVSTLYLNSENKIQTTFQQSGEYIFTYPDVGHVTVVPKTATPKDSVLINYQNPLKMEWSPSGFYNSFNLNIARDSLFQDLVLDSTGMKSTVYMLNDLKVNQDYYWRVKTINDAGESDWSETAYFHVYAPYIEVTSPSGGERWLKDQQYFIEWDDNIEEDVRIELYHDNEFLRLIKTVESRNAYRWTVPMDLDSTCGYHIKIVSTENDAIQASSAGTFSINAMDCIVAQVPYLNIKSPNGGETFRQGDTMLIEWANTTGESLDLMLYRGDTKITDLALETNAEKASWTIPGDINPANDYIVLIESNGSLQQWDASNGSFEINMKQNTSDEYAEASLQHGFRLYPNPVKDEINIEYHLETTQDISIKIFDLSGGELETIAHRKSRDPGTYVLRHNMSAYPAGSYIITFISKENLISRLIVLD